MTPKVSIVVPVYNAALFLDKCINSILKQSYNNWELFLVDDGSSDNSFELCCAYQAIDSRVVTITQPNSGPSAARNHGMKLSTAEFIAFVDADDWVHENYLQFLIAPFLEDKNVELSCGGYFELSKQNENGLPLHDFHKYLNQGVISSQVFYLSIFSGVTGVLWGKMFKTQIIKEYSLALDKDIKLSEDLLFVFEYAMHIDRIALVDENLYYYNRLHENGLSNCLKLNNLKDIQLTNKTLKRLSEKRLDLNLTTSISKRYAKSIVNLARDIACSAKDCQVKRKELQFIYASTTHELIPLQELNMENRIQQLLFINQKFTLLIGFVTFLDRLRKLKKKI